MPEVVEPHLAAPCEPAVLQDHRARSGQDQRGVVTGDHVLVALAQDDVPGIGLGADAAGGQRRGATHQVVLGRAALDPVDVRAAFDQVRAVLAEQQIVAALTEDRVVLRSAADGVRAGRTGGGREAAIAQGHLLPRQPAPDQHVGRCRPGPQGLRVVAGDYVEAGVAEQQVAGVRPAGVERRP